ncbi:MAG: aldose 1-epimerase family protein [Clostridia bacterium]|nr:aldose 1-epimerase family protein [Clostridia bacterium]
MNKYIGHPAQIYGVEEMRLTGGKGDGMRMLYVRNGKGLEFWVSLDRCADITRLSLKGDNFSFISACGNVSPNYYDKEGLGFLKSFTAGFCTTCGLTAVGNPCTDDGEQLPLHGTISNIPCENFAYSIEDNNIYIRATVRDARIFSHKLILEREYVVSLDENKLTMTDTVKNIGSSVAPYEILYHCNMGYPLLSEDTEIKISSVEVIPRNEHAKTGLADCLKVESPQADYEEMCYYHNFSETAEVSMYNPNIKKGMKMIFDANELKCFTQWKMMGEYDYVMGFEPGNCIPDGRDVMREKGMLEFIKPDESKTQTLKFEFLG